MWVMSEQAGILQSSFVRSIIIESGVFEFEPTNGPDIVQQQWCPDRLYSQRVS